MVRAQNGDRASYRRLLAEIVDLLRCRGRPHEIHGTACEELARNVLRTLHRVRHTYQPSRPFMLWLLAVLRCESGKQGYGTRDVLWDLSAWRASRIGQTNRCAPQPPRDRHDQRKEQSYE